MKTSNAWVGALNCFQRQRAILTRRRQRQQELGAVVGKERGDIRACKFDPEILQTFLAPRFGFSPENIELLGLGVELAIGGELVRRKAVQRCHLIVEFAGTRGTEYKHEYGD
jgi:hypothetical protein